MHQLKDIAVEDMWSQQNGATCHIETFPERVISRMVQLAILRLFLIVSTPVLVTRIRRHDLAI